jgi:hypothetical protein
MARGEFPVPRTSADINLMLPALLIASVLAVPPEQAGPVIQTPPWSCLFGARPAVLSYRLVASHAFRGVAAWSFAVEDRVLLRRETAVAVDAGRSGTLVVPLDLPAPRAGVVLSGRVAIAVDHGPEVVHRLWIFPDDPFDGRRAALEALHLTLFDPEQKTAAVFTRAQIPFHAVRNVAALAEPTDGLLVVGEGVSFDAWRSLARTLLDAAARGQPVLCLAPASGVLPLPGIGDRGLPQPSGFALRQADVITTFDKRLDTVWPVSGNTIAARIELTAGRSGIVGAVSAHDEAWPWLELTFPARRGRLVLCGFAMIAHWDVAPTPRYLLAHLFGHLSGQTLVSCRDASPEPPSSRVR